MVKARPADEASKITRFQLVVFRPPFDQNSYFVGRVIGLPAESLKLYANGFAINGTDFPTDKLPKVLQTNVWLEPRLLITNSAWVIASNQVFVIGDNLQNANDSRLWGPLATSNIVGKVSPPKQKP